MSKPILIIFNPSDLTLDAPSKQSKVDEFNLLEAFFRKFYRVRLAYTDSKDFQVSTYLDKLMVLTNPSLEQMGSILNSNSLILVSFAHKDIGYIGIVHDALSRDESLELPQELTWTEFLKCALQTSDAPIKFHI